MKPILLALTLLIATAIPGFAQKVDYRTFDVVARSGNIAVVVKDNDYRMVVGSLIKPKTVFLLGYSKEQAALKIKRLIKICENENYVKKDSRVSFCTVVLHLSLKEKDGKERYTIVREDDGTKFIIVKEALQSVKGALEII